MEFKRAKEIADEYRHTIALIKRKGLDIGNAPAMVQQADLILYQHALLVWLSERQKNMVDRSPRAMDTNVVNKFIPIQEHSMATTQTPSTAVRIIIEPLNGEGNVLERGKTTAKNLDEFTAKMDYAAKRCPKMFAIKTTMIEGAGPAAIVTHGFYTRDKGATEWTYSEQFPGTPTIPTTAKEPAKGPAKAKTTKRVKGPSGTTRGASSKGKPGVIQALIELLQSSVDEGGLTVKEIVMLLAKRFPSRDPESMEITVRCQLGRIPTQRNLKIGKQRVDGSKEVKYYIA